MDNIVFVCPTGAILPVELLVRGWWIWFAPRLHIVNYKGYGLRGLESNYAEAETQLLELYRLHGKLRLSAWSQGANHALRFTLRHPSKVERLLLITAPLKGSWLANLFQWVPACRDMSPGSTSCQALAADLVGKAKLLPPTVVLVAVQDGCIHEDAAMLPCESHGIPIQYHVFSNLPLIDPPAVMNLQYHLAPFAFHATMPFHPVVLWYVRQALTGPLGELIPPDPEPKSCPA